MRPAIREAIPAWYARMLRDLHPLRVQQWIWSDRNPMMAGVAAAAAIARAHRQPRAADNAGRRAEQVVSETVSATLDLVRDLRDAAGEAAFFQVYGNLLSLQMADQRAAIRRQTRFDPRTLPAVRLVLDDIDRGGLPEAIVRAALLVAKAGGGKRKLAQMQSVRALLEPSGLLRGMTEDDLRRILHDETIVVEFEPVEAKRTMPRLVRSAADRRKLHHLFDGLAADAHLNERQHALIEELRGLVPAGAGTPARLPSPRTVGRPAGRARRRAAKAAA